MKKLALAFLILSIYCCKTPTEEFFYPVEDRIKNCLSTDINVISFKGGKIKDSVLIKPNNDFLLVSEIEAYRQSQLFQLDSIRVRFNDNKTKLDIFCPHLFQNKDTIAGNLCVRDNINIFQLTRTKTTYDEKTRITTFLYCVDEVDYGEAK